MSIRRNVFKKASPNNKLVVYVGRRDVFDDLDSVDPMDGVAVIDHQYTGDRVVYARVQCEFRYGKEEFDNAVNGVEFKKAFYLDKMQVYPRKEKSEMKLTSLQERLLSKLGPNAYPFCFNLPHDIPSSIMLQPSVNEDPEAQPCGVEYTLQVYVENDKKVSMRKHNSVKIVFRRLTTAYPSPDAQPQTREASKAFHLHSGSIKLEANLPKEIFYHSEPIPVNIVIDNHSSNTIKRIKLQVIQMVEITLFKHQMFKAVVAEVETEYGFPINSGQTGWCQTYKLRPVLCDNRHQKGIALDGKLKHQDTNLASSTLIKDFRKKDTMGMVVHYSIRVKVVTGFGGRDTVLEIPFILTHQRRQPEKPADNEDIVFEKFARMRVDFPDGDGKSDTA